MKKLFTIGILLMTFVAIGQKKNFTSEEIKVSNWIDGTLLVPKTDAPTPLVIIIQGSGPTDRNGNQPMMTNNSLKLLAEALSQNDLATFRFDKRTIKLIQMQNFNEENISFEDFIDDVSAIVQFFKDDTRFSKKIIVGHSKGSLIGMIAAQRNSVDGFVSIAGAGQEIDDVIVDQLERQAPFLKESARKAFDDIRVNGFTDDYDQNLASIFRPGIQPFMRSWMEYNPQKEIKKLDIPVLILNGDEDLQVDENEAKLLKDSSETASLVIIEGMNHVLKKVDNSDPLDNGKSYNESKRPVMPELVDVISEFVESLE
ncbi:MAG TPA: alpha/beta fold hydrolase [Flavobacteriaceae bacterium]|nr:alpha/beta fold hydrolase [Flavobacteriaceae bacterium]